MIQRFKKLKERMLKILFLNYSAKIYQKILKCKYLGSCFKYVETVNLTLS